MRVTWANTDDSSNNSNSNKRSDNNNVGKLGLVNRHQVQVTQIISLQTGLLLASLELGFKSITLTSQVQYML